jgi:hypothetical protein
MRFLCCLLLGLFEADAFQFQPNLESSQLTKTITYDTENHVYNGRIQVFVADNSSNRLLGAITYFISTGQMYSMYVDPIIYHKDTVQKYLLDIAQKDLQYYNIRQMWRIEYKCILVFCCCAQRKYINGVVGL